MNTIKFHQVVGQMAETREQAMRIGQMFAELGEACGWDLALMKEMALEASLQGVDYSILSAALTYLE